MVRREPAMLLTEPKHQVPATSLFESTVSGSSGKQLKIIGPAIECDVEGINGRIYPYEVMEEAANRFSKEYIASGRCMGELNHPPVNEKGDYMNLPITEINLKRACHFIEKLWMEGNKMMMKSMVIDTVPAGLIVKGFIEKNIPIFVSLRGMGSTSFRGSKQYVDPGYMLITIDIVGRPSYGSKAKMESLVESVEYMESSMEIEKNLKAASSIFMAEVNASYKRSGSMSEGMSAISVSKFMRAVNNA